MIAALINVGALLRLSKFDRLSRPALQFIPVIELLQDLDLPRRRNFCIAFCYRDIGVAEDLLHRPEIRAVRQEVRGKGVAQKMRRRFWVDLCEVAVFIKNIFDGMDGDGGVASVDEETVMLYGKSLPKIEPSLQIIDGFGTREIDQPLLLAFSVNQNDPRAQIDVLQTDGRSFSDPDPRGAEQIQQGNVSDRLKGLKLRKRFISSPFNSGQKSFDAMDGNGAGEGFFRF